MTVKYLVFGSLVLAATLPASLACAWAESEPRQSFATGLVPVDPQTYAKLPSVKRHRGFYKPSVDLSDKFPAPGNQGLQGTCAVWSTTYAARSFLIGSEIGRPLQSVEIPSPEYVYSRVKGESADCSGGISMVQALDVLKDEGVVPLSDYPYDGENCKHSPPDALKAEASKLKIKGWRAVQRKTPGDWRTPIVLDDVKAQLSQGLPVVFAMQVSGRFMSWRYDSGIFHQDAPAGSWHAMALVGYDESKQAVRVINSWGRGWASNGYAWIDYPTFEALAGEAYVLDPAAAEQTKPAPAMPPTIDVDSQIKSLIAGTDCAALHLQNTDGKRVITGVGGLSPDLSKTRAAISALDPNTEWRVSTHPWPQCEAEITLAGLDDAQQVRLNVVDAADRPIVGDPVVLAKGQEFAIDVQTTEAKPYIDVFYIQADGSAVELYRGAPAPDQTGRRRVVVGADGARGVRFRVDTPFGDESLIALSSQRPLFDSPLSSNVTEREFLTLLRSKVVASVKDGTPPSAAIIRMKSIDLQKEAVNGASQGGPRAR